MTDCSCAVVRDLDVAEEPVETEVVDGLQGAGDDGGCAERELAGGAGDEWGERPYGVAGGVGVGGCCGALARVDDGDDVCLPGGHVHLRQREASEQQRDRARKIGREGDRGQRDNGVRQFP